MQLSNLSPYLFLPFILASLCSSHLFAQQKQAIIKGIVVDENQERIGYATISISGTKVGTLSDSEGNYELKTTLYRDQTLQISYLGYETKRVEVVLEPGKTIRLNVVLKSRAIESVEILVSAEKNTTRIEKQGFAATSIEVKQLQVENIELNQILDQNAGIRVRQQGGFGSRTQYSINGLGGKAVRFFLDGIPMDYFGSSFSINTIPVSYINRVDIYKGVVPVELGNDALGGAINLVSKEQLNNQIDLSYSYGSFNTHQTSLNGYWRENKSGFTTKLFAFYNYSDNNYEVWGEDISYTDPVSFSVVRNYTATRFHDSYESKAIKADLGFTEQTWADQIYLGLVLTKLDKEIQHAANMKVPFGDATYDQNVLMPYFQYQDRTFLIEHLSLNMFGAFSHLVRNRVDTSRNRYEWSGEISSDNDDRGEQTYTLNSLTENAQILRINLKYRFNEQHKLGYNQIFTHLERTDSDPVITNRKDGYFAPQNYTKHALGLTLQSQWFNELLHTSVFAKWFAYNAAVSLRTFENGQRIAFRTYPSKNTPGFGIAASYRLLPNLLISAAVERSVRLPEPDEILGDGLIILPDTSLKPERSLNFNLGATIDILNSRFNSLNLYCNFFYRDVRDQIKKVKASSEGMLIYDNFTHVTMTGFDGRLQYRYKQFSLTQSVSVLEPIIRSDVNSSGLKMVAKNPKLPNTPFFQANSELRISGVPYNNKNITSNLYWRFAYVGEFLESIEDYGLREGRYDEVPQQISHHAGITLALPKQNLALNMNVKNMFNAQLFDNYAVQKPGRAFYVKLSYQLN